MQVNLNGRVPEILLKTFGGARYQFLLTGGLFDKSYNALYGTLKDMRYF
jgi:hypothetical protein